MTKNKESKDFHTLSWMSMTVDVNPISGKDKKWFLSKSASSIQSKDAIVRGVVVGVFIFELILYWKLVHHHVTITQVCK